MKDTMSLCCKHSANKEFSLAAALVCMKQQKWLDHVLLLLTKIVEQDLFFVSLFVIILNNFDDKKWLSYKEAVAFIIIIIIINSFFR